MEHCHNMKDHILRLGHHPYLNFVTLSWFLDRYTYSDDASDEFDRDDGTLTLIKPSTIPSKDVQSSLEPRPVQANNGASNGDSEEDKTVMQNSVMML